MTVYCWTGVDNKKYISWMTARWRYLSPHPWTWEYSEIFTMPQDMKDLLSTKFFFSSDGKRTWANILSRVRERVWRWFFSDKVIASLEFTNTHIIVVERLSEHTSGFDSFFSSSLSMEKRWKYLDDDLESKSTGQLAILKLRHWTLKCVSKFYAD